MNNELRLIFQNTPKQKNENDDKHYFIYSTTIT